MNEKIKGISKDGSKVTNGKMIQDSHHDSKCRTLARTLSDKTEKGTSLKVLKDEKLFDHLLLMQLKRDLRNITEFVKPEKCKVSNDYKAIRKVSQIICERYGYLKKNNDYSIERSKHYTRATNTTVNGVIEKVHSAKCKGDTLKKCVEMFETLA